VWARHAISADAELDCFKPSNWLILQTCKLFKPATKLHWPAIAVARVWCDAGVTAVTAPPKVLMLVNN